MKPNGRNMFCIDLVDLMALAVRTKNINNRIYYSNVYISKVGRQLVEYFTRVMERGASSVSINANVIELTKDIEIISSTCMNS